MKKINCLVSIAATAAVSVGIPTFAQQRPNIILIMTDQQTADAMSNRGNPHVSTPAMDMLANDGVTFTRAYCSFPVSGPSRAGIMTGKMPHELNIFDNDQPLSETDKQKSIGVQMSGAGYECLYAGKWHVPEINIPNDEFGFRNIANMNDMELVDKVRPELKKEREKPLFLVASFLNPHEICEYARSQTLHYGEIEIPKSAKFPALPANHNVVGDFPEALLLHKDFNPKWYPTRNYTENDWRQYLYAYYRLVERVDNVLGDLIRTLKENDLYDNSLIIFTSDHGEGVAAHHWNQKLSLIEEVVNIPFIVKPPKNDKSTSTKINTETLVNIGLDIYPTICDYADVEVPAELNGISLKKVVRGETQTTHENIFIETFLAGVDLRAWCVVGKHYKYSFYRYYKQKEQLFDLRTDKGETHNLASDSKYENIRLDMRDKLRNYGMLVNDKMLLKELK